MDMTRIGEKIASVRKDANLSQGELAEIIGVSPQAVSKWENGHNLPDIENLMTMAEALNVPYSVFLMDSIESETLKGIKVRPRFFNEDNMFTRVKSFAQTEKLDETYRALGFMRECHAGQFRKPGKLSTERIKYINHPLLMACQAHAYGIRDDEIMAAILLHDTVEDCGVKIEDLPFSEGVRKLVELLTFVVPEGMSKEEAKKEYYEKISHNGKACLVKVLDRCNNVATMTRVFSSRKIIEYINETEEYVMPLLTVLKNNYPEYSDIAFLVKYQIISLLETTKYMMPYAQD